MCRKKVDHMVQKIMATTMIYEAPLVEITLLLWYAYAKAENDDEFEALCLKRIKTEPHFYFIYMFFATLRYAIDTTFYIEMMWAFF